MKRWLKWVLGIFSGLVVLGGLIGLWNKLEYFTPHPLIAHHKIAITLPYSADNDATSMISMGETIAHNFPGGHPGIDFQWDHSVPLIAVTDSKVIGIKNSNDMGEPVVTLTLKSGEYLIVYQELEKVAAGISKGVAVTKGEVIGEPHCHNNVDQNGTSRTSCQTHWEFGYSRFSPGFERLCPLSYFDADARARIEALWASIPADNRFKQNAPQICSNIYANRDQ
jgi:hypothetical protein